MEAGEEKGGWETGFYFLIFTDIVKMGWDPKPARNRQKVRIRQCKYIDVLEGTKCTKNEKKITHTMKQRLI